MQKIEGFNYSALVAFFESALPGQLCSGFQKQHLRDILSIVKGDKERECLRYVVYKFNTNSG